MASQRRFGAEVDNVWSDALHLLVTYEWERPFQEMKGVASNSSNKAVQCWMQVELLI